MNVENDGAPPHFVAKFEQLVRKSGLLARFGSVWFRMTWIPSLGLVSALIDGKQSVAASSPEELFALVLDVLYRSGVI